jgi:hypothetical protein
MHALATREHMPVERNGAADRLARGLGYFSIALGVAEVLMPRTVAKAADVNIARPLLTVYGGREISAGVGLLRASDPAPWLWGRVGGDAVDIATVALGRRSSGSGKGRFSLALTALIGITAIDAIAAILASQNAGK